MNGISMSELQRMRRLKAALQHIRTLAQYGLSAIADSDWRLVADSYQDARRVVAGNPAAEQYMERARTALTQAKNAHKHANGQGMMQQLAYADRLLRETVAGMKRGT